MELVFWGWFRGDLVEVWRVNSGGCGWESPGSKSLSLLTGLFVKARAPRLIQDESREGYGLKAPKSSCRVVSSGSFTAFRMTAETCKCNCNCKVRNGWGNECSC